ncbi:AMP-binding protein [Pseudoneobacillus sp. C159]
MLQLVYTLYQLKLLSLSGVTRLVAAITQFGVNLMVLLKIGERYGDHVAIVDDQETISYQQLLIRTENLASILKNQHSLKSGQKAAIFCENSIPMIKAIFALSSLGVDIYLLNVKMTKGELQRLIDHHQFDLLVYDDESLLTEVPFDKNKAFNILEGLETGEKVRLSRTSMGKLVLLTSGTTGVAKEAAHKPSIFYYLNPFLTMLKRLELVKYHTAYIATPIFHGYGLAVLLVFLALGKKVVISKGFEAEKACRLIKQNAVEVVTVVPLMVQKMQACRTADLMSLKCIASGGARLNPKLVDEVTTCLGDVLYNLYGTSETGLNIIATPKDLRYSPKTIGRKISGMRLRILGENGQPVANGKIGQFCVKNKWSMKDRNDAWIKTGDVGYRDGKGYYFLTGRIDDMIVSGGVNVYPIELEQVLSQHPEIVETAVIGMNDERFGQRLKAFVQKTENSSLSEDELFHWVRQRVANYQMPKEIFFIEKLPYTSLGKIDKKMLKTYSL